jgi:glucose/arabinose dehydrogenase
MSHKRLLLAAGGALVAVVLVAAAVCRLGPYQCHGSGEQDIFQGIGGTGIGPTRLPPGFRQEVVASGFSFPTSFALLPDGRILVGEKSGLVHLVVRGRIRRPLVDLRRHVADYGYRGLLALEADPTFVRTGRLYVLYIRQDQTGPLGAPRTARLSRIDVRGRRIRERFLLGAEGRGSCNELPRGSDCIPCDDDHCGGDIEVADDGSLFVSTGDGWGGDAGFNANTLRAQRLDTLAGKILHVTADGRGRPDNPFWDGDPASNRSKIWAYGLRNPFRLTLGPGGPPFVGDVGWNDWEEIDAVPKGGNMGWPCYEGFERPEEYADQPVCRALYGRSAVHFPVVVHPRGSITGGVFYEATSFPARYRDGYFYGDWSRSELYFLRLGPDGRTPLERREFATNAAGPVQLEVGPDGSLYYLALNAGELRRIVYGMRS